MKIYSRAEWGARHAAGWGDRSANYPLNECWTHHAFTAHLSEHATVAQEIVQMQILENIGQQRFGKGISYSFVIFPSGRVYMGLGASRIGAHTGGRNSVSLGACFAGNYETNRPTAAAERGYANLLKYLKSLGILRNARTNGGHKDAPNNGWNACPGRYLHPRLGAINALASSSSVKPQSAPKPAPKPVPKPAPKPVAKPKPKPAGSGPWPTAYLTVTTKRNQYQDKALLKLLGDTPDKWTGTLAMRLQRHLRKLGYYKGYITWASVVGPQTIRAWQEFLRDRKYYSGAIDGKWGPQTVRGTVLFLNKQAELY